MELLVTLPKRNRLITKLFNTVEADSDLSKINTDLLNSVIQKSFGSIPEYKVKIEKNINAKGREVKQDGQFIIIENDSEKKYIFFSYEYANGSRNGYIMAKVPIAFRRYYFDKTTKNKKLEICLLDVDEKYHSTMKNKELYAEVDINKLKSIGTINNYNTFVYKLCKTLGFTILNESSLPYNQYKDKKVSGEYVYRKNELIAQKGFASINEIKKMRDLLAGKNTDNKGSYILEFEDSIIIYGKTFGNNGFEMVLISCAIGQLAKAENKKVHFYQIKDTLGRDGENNRDAKPITQENIQLMKSYGIQIYDELREYEENPDVDLTEDKDSRNQLEFMKNLIKKFGNTDEKRCYLCDCAIQKLIIASHIQRVTDINKLDIPFAEKRKKAVDADNGFWLCANHDKMFEHGIITFDEETGALKIDLENVDEQQRDYIIKITQKMNISSEHFNENLKHYLKIHNDRLKKVIGKYNYCEIK